MKIYLASSFAYADRQKTEERKATMEKFENNLLARGFTVYSPSKLKIKNAWDYSMWDYSMWDWGQLVFEADYQELNECDLVVFISYGKENNAGSAWEVGYSFAKQIPIIMVSMDKDSPESLMLLQSATACLQGYEEFKDYDLINRPAKKISVIES